MPLCIITFSVHRLWILFATPVQEKTGTSLFPDFCLQKYLLEKNLFKNNLLQFKCDF